MAFKTAGAYKSNAAGSSILSANGPAPARLESLQLVGLSALWGLQHQGYLLFDELASRSARTVVAYNLDFNSQLMLKTHAPVVHEIPGGRMVVEWTAHHERTEPEVAQRCLNFVIDTAIRVEALA